ncbi:MAG: ATP-binding cassette domain-containing protein [Planctomycetota bacterium]|jgi:urea transport system ATP-binding protein|nr:ATP-binding cassette domain-containing protein [Planctomycetota bacterium]
MTSASTAAAHGVNIYDYTLEGPRNSQLWSRYYLLALQDVTAVFDGFKALDIVDLGIGHNELRVVVGPNGAGKTTMCDVISGLTKPTTGKVYFDGEEITGLDESVIAQRGVGRKFQIPNVFDSLTVWENMLLAVQPKLRDNQEISQRLEEWDPRVSGPAGVALYRMVAAFRNAGGRPDAETKDRMLEILGRVRLLDERDTVAKNLSHGQRQWLAISALMVSRPKLLLVDEPAAGLTDSETELTAQLLNELKGEHTIIVIEHDMEFVRALGSRVTVLNEGTVLADGSLDEVSADERVIEAYLGR